MNTNSINKSFFIFLFAFFTTASVSAQEIVLFGNVSSASADGSFMPVSGAYVGLEDPGNSDHYDLTDEAGNYEFSFLWNWDGSIAVICEAEGYHTQTTTLMPEGEAVVELNFILSPSQQEQDGVLFGIVTYQVSPMGPDIPVPGAVIGATPSWGPEPWFQTETNEDGHYELELWANEAPWIVYCTTEYGQQETEVVITAGHETEQNFHFNAWDEQPETPYDLVAEYNPSGDGLYGSAILDWEYNSLDPTESFFHVYLYLGNSNIEWMLIGEISETHYEHVFGDYLPPSNESCFKITAVSNGEESEPSNIACVYLDESGNGIVYGTVYEMSLDPNEVIPIAGAVIHFFIADMAWAVVTGDNGGYEISLPEGTYQTWVEAEGYLPNDDESVTLIPNEEVEQNYYLLPHDGNELVVLRGFVRGESENDPSGWQPLPGSQIRATPNDQEEPVYEGITNEDGFYELPLPAGYYDVTATHEGYQPGSAYVHVGSNNENWHDFYLEHAGSQNAGIHGNVLWISPNGNEVPVPGAQIRAEEPDANIVYETESGDGGGYGMEVMANHYYLVTCTIQFAGMEMTMVHDVYVGNDPVELNFEFGGEPPVNASILGHVRIVTPNGNPSPVLGAVLMIMSENGEFIAVTESNDQGFYQVEVYPNNHYVVTCTIETEAGPMTQTQDCYVAEHPVELNFVFGDDEPQSAGIHGLVYWETPNWGEIMISGAQIRAESSDANLAYEAETDDGGGYGMEVMGDHHYVVTCTAEFEGMELVQVHDVYVGESWVELNFSFGGGPPEVALLGHVFGIELDMIYQLPGAYVYATPTGPTDPVWETHADSTGFYFLELPIGEYSVTAMYEGFETVTEEVFVGPNGENIQDFYLPQQGTSENGLITGNVWMVISENDQTPIPGALLWAHSDDGLVFEVTTNENGHYEMEVSGNHHYNVSCYAFVGSDTLWAEEDIYVFEGVVVELNFSFGGVPSEFGWLEGFVHDSTVPDTFPISGAIVMAYSVTGEFITETNEEGHFEMELPLETGWDGYQVMVQAEGFQYYYHPEPVYIYPNEETFLEIWLEPSSSEVGHVYGMVIDGAQNYPISGAVVWAVNDAHEFETHTDSQGEFDFELPAGTYELSAGAEGYNPSSETMIEIEDGDIVTVNITLFPHSQMEIAVDYMSGWNLVGLPLEGGDPGGNCSPVSDAFGFTYEGYTEVENLVPGSGYWLRFSNECTAEFTGNSIDTTMLVLMAGWNLISGISYPTHINNIYDYDGILVPNTIFGFDERGYTNAEYLEPGRGYWVRTYDEGQIIISTWEGNASEKSFTLSNHLAIANTISFNGKALHFGADVPEEHRLSYSLPPKPFSGAFDVRFSGGWTYVDDYGEIELQGTTNPVTIDFNITIPAGENLYWNLIDNFDNEYVLDGSGSIRVFGGKQTFILNKNRVIPEEISLHQNYPNPFNPITTIGFSLPEEINVTLRVYDVAGRMVSELVNGKLVSGVHEVRWDASYCSNGVYFVRMESGNKIIQTQKMILLK